MAKRPTTEDSDSAPDSGTPDVEVIDVEVTDISEGERPRRPGAIVWVASAVIVVGIGLIAEMVAQLREEVDSLRHVRR